MAELERVLEEQGLGDAPLRRLKETADDIRLLSVSGVEAEATWRKLRSLVEVTGRWPVMLGGQESLEMHEENLELAGAEDEGETGAVLRKAGKLDAEGWLRREERKWSRLLADYSKGDWPPVVSPMKLTIARDILTGEPCPEVFLALLPTTVSWEAPAYLRFGGWNACPHPEEHVALFRRWHELYGAEIAGISTDVLEASVSRPPKDRESALQLAREQMLYCDDIVTQGVGLLPGLAAHLLGSSAWYFWWD